MDLSQKGAPKQENVLCLGQANMDSLVSMFKVRAQGLFLQYFVHLVLVGYFDSSLGMKFVDRIKRLVMRDAVFICLLSVLWIKHPLNTFPAPPCGDVPPKGP